MARLFVTNREISFINDIVKEYIKDVIGQYIVYYPVNILKTNVHDVYDEAIEKIFDNPIKLDCLVGQPERAQVIGTFSIEKTTTLEVLLQAKDLIDKNFVPSDGDFFVYGEEVYEIMNAIEVGDLYGQAENNNYWKLNAKTVRSGRFDLHAFRDMLVAGKTFKEGNGQKVFEQQRGLSETDSNGATGDVRELRRRLGNDMAEIALGEGPRVVNSQDEADSSDTSGEEDSSSFYNE